MPDEVLRARADQLAALALAVHAETAKRAPGASHVVALDQGEETVLVSINDDRPFLFDSSLQAVMAAGGRIRAAYHPVIELGGVLTSVIALVCDTMSSEVRQKLIDSLRETFAQGAAGGGAH
jgi:NAD-specific glutamate dehydrogenase